MFHAKDLEMEVVIISPMGNEKEETITANTVENLVKNYDFFVIAPKNPDKKQYKYTTFFGENSIASLCNEGIRRCRKDWAYIVFAGSKIRKYVDVKLSRYAESEKDVIFPVVDRKWNFIDATTNGLLINKNFYMDVGNFKDVNDFKLTKLEWADKAIAKGAKFKAIVNSGNF
jgi:hypothetical protein